MKKSETHSKNVDVKASDEHMSERNSAIIGTYEGECADANITNLNGLDITREVWETVFNSDTYKQAIENGWYIGYLGHPEDDPDCQDFRRACIVMTEGHIDDNGKVYGKFNLIDTPVGRIVKAFQDAGVIFGISVRGAGDIIQNSVDPETFVFRGFDLVTFPAFPNSIPTFIAASTDVNQRQKYQAVCASVKENIEGLDTVESINIVQSCFAKQSDEYQELEARKSEIISSDDDPELPLETLDEQIEENCIDDSSTVENVVDPRVDSMTKMYLELKENYDTLAAAHAGLQSMYDSLVKEDARKFASIERIFSSQMNDMNRELKKVECSLKVKSSDYESLKKTLDRKERQLTRIQSSLELKNSKISELTSQVESVNKQYISASKKLRKEEEENLKYNKKVESAQISIDNKDAIIANLKSELAETVRKHTLEQEKSSNLDDQMVDLKSRIVAAEYLIKGYQDAYANLYANAVGIRLPELCVTASTDVTSLQNMIRANSSIPTRPDFLEPTQEVDPSYFDVVEYDEDDLVTL